MTAAQATEAPILNSSTGSTSNAAPNTGCGIGLFYAKQSCTIDTYTDVSTTTMEVAKLTQSPEFKLYYEKNGERLRAIDRAAVTRAYIIAAAALSLSFAAAAVLPWSSASNGKSLLAMLEPATRATDLLSTIPMSQLLFSSLGAKTFAPLVAAFAYFSSLLSISPVAGPVGTVSLIALVIAVGAGLAPGLGFYVQFGILGLKVFLSLFFGDN